ncbi:MAG: hypothetical protein WCV86_01960 [Patescibacteria group bacterium]|jgi:hypothetical protein
MTMLLSDIWARVQNTLLLVAMYCAEFLLVALIAFIGYGLTRHWAVAFTGGVATYWLIGYLSDAQGLFLNSVPWTWEKNTRRAWIWPYYECRTFFR